MCVSPSLFGSGKTANTCEPERRQVSNGFPYWQFHCDRWLCGKVSSFSLEEQGLFLHLCMAAWVGQGSFAASVPMLARRFNRAESWIDGVIASMCDCGMIMRSVDGYRIKFIDEQLDEMRHIRGSRSFAGKKSAIARHAASDKKEEEKSIVVCSTHVDKCSTHVQHMLTMPIDGWSLTDVSQVAERPTVAMPYTMVQGYFDHRTKKGWVDAGGIPVAKTLQALESDMRSWKVAQPSHGKKVAGVSKSTLTNVYHQTENTRHDAF